MKIKVTYIPSEWNEQLVKLEWSDHIELKPIPF